jgi:extracellular matrix regulatory protein A
MRKKNNKKDKKISKSFINIGFDNVVAKEKIVAIVSPQAAPIKRIKEESRRRNKLIDATSGRKARSVIITDSDHVVLSAIQPDTITGRIDK